MAFGEVGTVLSKIKSPAINLADTFAFSGTVTGFPKTPYTLLSTFTSDGSDANATFNSSVITDAFDEYLFIFNNLHFSADVSTFTFNGSIDNGSNYNIAKTSTSFYAYHNEGDSHAAIEYVGAADLAQSTGEQVLFEGLGGDADQSLSGEMFLFNPSSTTFVKHYMYRACNSQQSDQFRVAYKAGYCNVTAAIDGVKFSISSGNIEAGTIKLYGIL